MVQQHTAIKQIPWHMEMIRWSTLAAMTVKCRKCWPCTCEQTPWPLKEDSRDMGLGWKLKHYTEQILRDPKLYQTGGSFIRLSKSDLDKIRCGFLCNICFGATSPKTRIARYITLLSKLFNHLATLAALEGFVDHLILYLLRKTAKQWVPRVRTGNQ